MALRCTTTICNMNSAMCSRIMKLPVFSFDCRRLTSSNSESSSSVPGARGKDTAGNESTCTLSHSPSYHGMLPNFSPLIPLTLGPRPKLYTLSETDFGMQEQIHQFSLIEARGLGFLSIKDVLADFDRVAIIEKQKLEKITKPDCIEEPLVNDAVLAVKRTFQPNTLRRKRKHGFLARIGDRHGRKIIERRRAKHRTRLAS